MSAPRAHDPIDALAALLRVSPEVQAVCRFGQRWRSDHAVPEPVGWAGFHLVIAGSCVLDVDDSPPVALAAGDIALLPHGESHAVHGVTTLREQLGVPGLRVAYADGMELRSNGAEPEAELICGRLRFHQLLGSLARAMLPALIVLRTTADPAVVASRALLLAIKHELGALGPG